MRDSGADAIACACADSLRARVRDQPLRSGEHYGRTGDVGVHLLEGEGFVRVDVADLRFKLRIAGLMRCFG